MSEDKSPIEGALAVFGALGKDFTDFLLQVMKVHPVMGVIVWNWLMNAGYALTNEWAGTKEEPVLIWYEEEMGIVTPHMFASRMDLMAHVFRSSAKVAGLLAVSEAASNVFSIDIDKVMKAIG